MAKTRLGILISGRGSNMEALIAACAAPDYPAEIACVLSNRPAAAGLKTAEGAGIKALAIDSKDFDNRQAFETEMQRALKDAGVELICLAGFMRLLTPKFVNGWQDRILNIHPSLLPAFKGLRIHQRVLEAGIRITGCTVHFVRPEMDDGPIVIQAAVPVMPDDTPDTLAARILGFEHRIYPQAVRLVASGAARVEGDRVIIAAETATPEGLTNPPA